MSTILKALRRLEQDKSAHIRRPLREEVATEPVETRRGVPLLLSVGGIFAAGVALGAVALLFWPRPGPEAPAPAVSERTAAVPRPAPPPAERRAPERAAPEAQADPAPEPAPRGLAQAMLVSPVEVVERPVPETPRDSETVALPTRPPGPGDIRPGEVAMRPRRPAPAAGAPSEPASPPAPEPAVAAPPAVAAQPEPSEPAPVAVAERPASPPARAPQVEPAPRTAAPAQVATAPRTAAGPVPVPSPEAKARVDAAGEQVSAAVPEITPRRPAVEPAPAPAAPRPAPAAAPPAPAPVAAPPPQFTIAKTHWHPLPERRLAIVDVSGRDAPLRVHEGDRVGSLRVAEIEPSAVVFLRDGVEERHPVGAD